MPQLVRNNILQISVGDAPDFETACLHLATSIYKQCVSLNELNKTESNMSIVMAAEIHKLWSILQSGLQTNSEYFSEEDFSELKQIIGG